MVDNARFAGNAENDVLKLTDEGDAGQRVMISENRLNSGSRNGAAWADAAHVYIYPLSPQLMNPVTNAGTAISTDFAVRSWALTWG